MRKRKIFKLLHRAHLLIEDGKITESLEFLSSLEPINNYNKRQKTIFYTLNSEIHLLLGDYPKAYEIAEYAMEYANKIGRKLEAVDSFLNMARILLYMEKSNESMNLLKECSEILKNLPKISEKDRNQRNGVIYSFMGFNFYFSGEMIKSIEMLKKSIELLKRWGSQPSLSRAYALFGYLLVFTGEYNEAQNYLSKSQKIFENKESPQYNISKVLNSIGMGLIFHSRGELQLALEIYKKCVIMAQKYNYPTFIGYGLNNLGLIYHELGEWDLAIKNLKEAMLIFENQKSSEIVYLLDSFFQVYIAMGDIPAARQKFLEIEQYHEKGKDDKNIDLIYRLNKAILMKMSKRTRDLGGAQEIFQKIAHEEIFFIEMTQIAILNLCEMLLDEFKDTQSVESLEEFSSLLKNLQEASEKQQSFKILAETYVLNAKYCMLKFELKKARHLLTKAQQIAERYGLNRLAIKISIEHDNLLQNLEIWAQMKEENVSISERLEKIDIKDQISTMLKKKIAKTPETSPESPILLLIMANSGIPIYTKIFNKEWQINEELFSGFLSAFNSFSDEIFSEGLDRANFGKFTILMTEMPPFMICYVFKGQSFLAHQKFIKFNKTLHESEQIWMTLTSSNHTGQVIKDDTSEGLGKLVKTIF